MKEAKQLRIYLDNHLQRRVAQGKHNFLGHVVGAFEGIGWRVEICPDDDPDLLRARTLPGHSLFNMLAPVTENGLTFRLSYVFPFWKIEKTGTRWEFESAGAPYDPRQVDPDQAKSFFNNAKNRLFPEWQNTPSSQDFIYVPLQGQLLQKRAHQSMSPIDMVRKTAVHHPDSQVLITLHPKETYSREELSVLDKTVAGFPLARISTKSSALLIPHASKIVTQNSSIAFTGMFFEKPAFLFAQSDFHHIATNIIGTVNDGTFSTTPPSTSDFQKYPFWFLQMNSINAGRDDVRTRILHRVEQLGWKL